MEEKKYIFCSNCGEKLVATAKFCNACGTRIAATTPPPVEPKKEPKPITPPPFVSPPPVQSPVTPPPVPNSTPAPDPAPKKERATVYDGEIHKCPNCGEVVQSFVTNCPACGFELNRKQVSAVLQKFIDRVEECDRRISNCPESKTGWAAWNKTKRFWWVVLNLLFLCIPLVIYLVWPLVRINSSPKLTSEERQLASVIENFPFPNDRESILAALVYTKEKIDFISKEKIDRKSAYWMRLWCAKAEQLKQKADMMFPNDPIVKESYNEILADDARVKKTIKIKGIVGLVILAIVIVFAIVRYGVLDRVGVTGGPDYSATFEWQNYGLFTQIPEPETNNGKIVRESTDQINIELYHVSADDFNEYVKACKNAGFTVDITKTDQVFYAHDNEGYDLNIFFYEDRKTMNIYVDSYDIEDDVQQNGQSEVTNTETSNQGAEDQVTTTTTTESSVADPVAPTGTVLYDTQVNYHSVDSLTITDFGYQQNDEYIWCVVELTNPSQDKAIELPTYRVTAYDADNKILGSEEQTLSIIYPGQKFICAAVLIEVGAKPHRIDITVLEPEDYNISSVSTLEHSVHKQMVGQNLSVRNGSITGEILNPNDYKIDSAMITVIFRDSNGVIVYSRLAFIDQIPANGSIPFDVDLLSEENLPSTYEVYAYIW